MWCQLAKIVRDKPGNYYKNRHIGKCMWVEVYAPKIIATVDIRTDEYLPPVPVLFTPYLDNWGALLTTDIEDLELLPIFRNVEPVSWLSWLVEPLIEEQVYAELEAV